MQVGTQQSLFQTPWQGYSGHWGRSAYPLGNMPYVCISTYIEFARQDLTGLGLCKFRRLQTDWHAWCYLWHRRRVVKLFHSFDWEKLCDACKKADSLRHQHSGLAGVRLVFGHRASLSISTWEFDRDLASAADEAWLIVHKQIEPRIQMREAELDSKIR
jgi:hypothetical protein